MARRILYPLLFITILSGCDPARVLIIKASNKPNVSVKVYANEGFLPRGIVNNNKKIFISVPSASDPAKRDTLFFYGIGCWQGDELMASFANNIDSIIINNSSGKLSLKSQPEIKSYLLKHRHGFCKSRLTIKAK